MRWQSPQSYRRQVLWGEWRVNEANQNNDTQEVFRWTGRKSRTPHLRWQLARRFLDSSFLWRKCDEGQLWQNRSWFRVRKNPSRANEIRDHPQAGITSSFLSCSVKRGSSIGVKNTCAANVCGDPQHYRTSVVIVNRQYTPLCSQPRGRNSRVDDNRWMELRSNIGEPSRLWNAWVFGKCSFGETLAGRPRLSQDELLTFSTVKGRFAKNQNERFQFGTSSIRSQKKRQRQLPQMSLRSYQLSKGRSKARTRNFCAL